MNYIDIIIIIIALAFLINGLIRGFILSFMQLFGLIVIIVLIREFGELIRAGIHERIGVSVSMATIIGYTLIFISVMLLANLLAVLMDKFAKRISLGWLNSFLGSIMGFVFGLFVIVILVMILEASSVASVLGGKRTESKLYRAAHIMSQELITNYVYHLHNDSI